LPFLRLIVAHFEWPDMGHTSCSILFTNLTYEYLAKPYNLTNAKSLGKSIPDTVF